ncbi:MAG: peptide deformylase [Anaerolineae bacterium]|nr:MAG: peptide deformylase [Anaerolineae bacterium]
MSIRTIVTVPHPVLRQKAGKVTTFDQELQTLIDDMIETMRAAPGVGLAAPQVNVPLRLFVAEYGDDDDPDAPVQTYVFINPRIVAASRETEVGVEGCLSIPGLVGEVIRAQRITVNGLDRHGKPLKMEAHGWLARIFQHEIDHLDGVLFTDHALRVWRPEEETEPHPAAD